MLLGSRGELVVRELCSGVDAERFFAMAAKKLVGEADGQFARDLVWMLNRVLLTSYETRKLRKTLLAAALSSPRPATGPSAGVPPNLLALLNAWFHCPVSTLALCLWFHWFELADEIVARLSRVDLSATVRKQLLEFVEYFESPVFMRVRLQLLETRKHPALLRAVLGLAALLPQEHPLQARLSVVETGLLLDRVVPQAMDGSTPKPLPKAPLPAEVDETLRRFDAVVKESRWCECVL